MLHAPAAAAVGNAASPCFSTLPLSSASVLAPSSQRLLPVSGIHVQCGLMRCAAVAARQIPPGKRSATAILEAQRPAEPMRPTDPRAFTNTLLGMARLGGMSSRRRPDATASLRSCAYSGTMTWTPGNAGDTDGGGAAAAYTTSDDEDNKERVIENVENSVERRIFDCRFLTLLAVIGSLVGSAICFVKGCLFVLESLVEFASAWWGIGSGNVILLLVEAVDVYLIGTVMLIFGMGLYDLFIHNFNVEAAAGGDGANGARGAHGSGSKSSAAGADPSQQRKGRGARGGGARRSLGSNLFGLFRLQSRPSWLEVSSLDEMKTKLGHVIVMILLVGTFEKSKKVVVATSMDFLCFSVGVCFAAGCLFLLTKLHLHHGSEHGGAQGHGGQENAHGGSQGQGHGAAAVAASAAAADVGHVNGHVNGHMNGQVNGHVNGHVYMNGYVPPEYVMGGSNHSAHHHGYMNGHEHVNGHGYGHVNGHRQLNGHASGHLNGHVNGHANGHANGHVNGHANGHDVNGVRHISDHFHTGAPYNGSST
ncbi:hypothetical protein CLOP_g9730 [Closterium sp. NIES-67]|nr:hypothetical protein CLOP_g9730 [Closterium sp. NIES-67]